MMPSKLLLGSLAAASSAFILGMLSTSSCQFASVSFSLAFTQSEPVDDVFRMDTSPTNVIPIFLGLWRHQSFGIKNGSFFVADTCEEYSSQNIVDGNWVVARAFGILALVIGGVHALIISWLSFGSKKSFLRTFTCMKISPWIHLLCCLFQALTLIILRNEFCNQSLKQGIESLLERATIEWGDRCELELGSKMAIASVAFWFSAFILALVHVTGLPNRCPSLVKNSSANASANNSDRENEQNAVSIDEELDEEVATEVENPPTLVVPNATDSVASKPATGTSRETSTPAGAKSSPKTSPSKQNTSHNADNESRVSSVATRNVSILSSRVTSSTAGRRRAKYR
ncbi:hypothetical protein QTG54_002033 [Skeletonema marinoi]|uniref:Transmembrane protein n=1 Tax=Skeletonema marinoi TaxID=267567 RepID=A0AAD8YJI8_9STRA|nr:hypothetical protein QTG54_002033 [Skeletonema marinoi]